MNVIRSLIRLPIVNILMFACFPFQSYREYLLWVIEDNGLTIDTIWDKLDETQKEVLRKYGLSKSANEKISCNIKEDDKSGDSEAKLD